MSDLTLNAETSYPVRQGRGSQDPSRPQDPRRQVRPRCRPGAHHPRCPRDDEGAQDEQRPAHHRPRRQGAARPPRTCSATRSSRSSSTSTWSSCARARRSPSTSRSTSRVTLLRTPWSPPTARASSLRSRPPTSPRASPSRSRASRPARRSPRASRALKGATLITDAETFVVNVTAQVSEEFRGRARRGRGRGRHRARGVRSRLLPPTATPEPGSL